MCVLEGLSGDVCVGRFECGCVLEGLSVDVCIGKV